MKIAAHTIGRFLSTLLPKRPSHPYNIIIYHFDYYGCSFNKFAAFYQCLYCCQRQKQIIAQRELL